MSKVTMRRPDARAMAQLLAEQTQTAAGLILRLAWRQGLTREEIQRLTWNDVDFSAHQLRLPDRTIPLETETEDCLRRQAERPDPPTPFVVVSDRRRQQMPPESISRLARKTLDRAGLGGISLMDLRHDFIIRHLESHDWPYVARVLWRVRFEKRRGNSASFFPFLLHNVSLCTTIADDHGSVGLSFHR